jgi:hypothetical protein
VTLVLVYLSHNGVRMDFCRAFQESEFFIKNLDKNNQKASSDFSIDDDQVHVGVFYLVRWNGCWVS